MSESSIVDRLASAITQLHSDLVARPDDAFRTLAHSVLAMLPEAEHVGVSRLNGDGLELLAATSDVVERFATHRAEIPIEPAGAATADETDVRSALSLRLPPPDDADQPMVLTVLSSRPAAFSEQHALTAFALTSCGLFAAAGVERAARVRNLERALETNREIATAVGVIMALRRTTREHAFELLRTASQMSHRKVSDLARSVVETGALDFC